MTGSRSEPPAGSGDFTVAAGALGEQGINGDSLVTTAAALLLPGAGRAPVLPSGPAVEPGADLAKVTASSTG